MKVFISSTYEDLIAYRKVAIEVVNDYKCTPIAMEHFIAQPQEPETVLEKEINECDIFVGIYAHRYGYIPEGRDISITRLEYQLAKELEKDCLCFIVKKGYLWNPDFIEMEKYPKLQDFLSIVKKDNTVPFFESAADFAYKFSISLGNLLLKKRQNGAQEEGVKRSCGHTYIPLAPTPYIAHPYPLPKNFTGRDAEQAALSNWFHNEKESLYVLEAIGGMGKSALTWVWMKESILENFVEVDGIFWWSFYEDPFESFLQQLACYVLGKEHNHESLLSTDLAKLHASLYERRFLLVLDGLERVLRGYSSINAMFIPEEDFEDENIDESDWEKKQREPVHPLTDRFLRYMVSGKTKTIITTRLMPTSLDELSGVRHKYLKGLSEGDAVRFLRTEGIKGNRAELGKAGKAYDYHPLMLKLLTSAIKRSRTKDIAEVFRLNLIDDKEPHQILSTSFNLLSQKERKVAASIAVFRGVFTFESARALFPKMKEDRLWQVMQELRKLGFLFYDEKEDQFDFHPIMRSFLYHRLTDRTRYHSMAAAYFKALPGGQKITTQRDLAPVIELYYHLVKAGKFNRAFKLFKNRILDPAYFQLSAYHLVIELLNELFTGKDENLPFLENETDQAWTLNVLANTYALSGQPTRSIQFYIQFAKLSEKNEKKEDLAIALGALASVGQLPIGCVVVSNAHFQKSIAISREISNEFQEAVGHQEFALSLNFQGRIYCVDNQSEGKAITAENELAKSTLFWKKDWEKGKKYHGLSLDYAYRSISALFQARLMEVQPGSEGQASDRALEALKQARIALELAEEFVIKKYPRPRDFIQAYWLIGESIIQCCLSAEPSKIEPGDIYFYDEYFQYRLDSIVLENGSELAAAERCLNEALRRCRSVNLLELEPDILLSMARWTWVKVYSQSVPERKKCLISIEQTINEAHEVCLRSGYRLKLADIHLFCGRVLLELDKNEKLLDLTAGEHLRKTREYALDMSGFSDLYQSADPHFYDGIPEYEMLKQGMSHEKPIQSGYYVAANIAAALGLNFLSLEKK